MTSASDAVDHSVRIPACGRPLRTYTTHLLFDASPGAAVWRNTTRAEDGLRVRFHLRNRSKRIAAQRYEVVLELTLSCAHGQDAVYRAEVHQAGTFDLAAIAEAERGSVLHTDCARVLFLLAKQTADGLVREGGFPPFQLPPIDFDAIHARHHHAAADPAPMRQLREFWNAVTRLQASGRVSPRPHDFHAMHGESLAVAQLSRDALPAADRVLAQSPDDPVTLEMLSAVYSMNNAHQRAVEVYRHAVSARPGDARAHYNLATSLMFTGGLAGAEREIDLCIECQPTFWDAYSVRSKVRRQTAPENHIDELRALLNRHGDQPQARERLHMALAKEYEDLGD
ncbi:MAG: protein-export chaperone SecB, partial [Rhodanobacteraceae bacterium]